MNESYWMIGIFFVAIIVVFLITRHHSNKATKIVSTSMDNSIESWQKFYLKYFGLVVDFSQVKIPTNLADFLRIIFIAEGLRLSDVLKAMTKAGIKWWTYAVNDDLDKIITENVRNPTTAYAIRIRERVEADEELKDLSANQLKERGVNCMTLLERAVYGLKYFSETGQHLDIVNYTLCAGSRDSDGHVPRVSFYPHSDDVRVSRWRPDRSGGYLRVRQVVS